MSNETPDLSRDSEVPCCIWYLDIAFEHTYRILVNCYPRMRYQVGRACAVAGNTALFHKLDLPPEVYTAEEA